MIEFFETIWNSKNNFCAKNKLTGFDGLGLVDPAQIQVLPESFTFSYKVFDKCDCQNLNWFSSNWCMNLTSHFCLEFIFPWTHIFDGRRLTYADFGSIDKQGNLEQ